LSDWGGQAFADPEKRARGPATRDAILEASRLQFNRNGVQATAVSKIAGDLSISSGNLNYHFKGKGEIIAGLADALDHEIASAARPFSAEAPRGESFIQAMEGFLTVLWRYRFFFNASHYLGGISPDLALRQNAMRLLIRNMIRRSTADQITRGTMRAPRAPSSATLIGDNIVSVWIAWLQETVPDNCGDDIPPPGALRNCIEHHFGVIEPYVSQAFIDRFCKALDQH
jgi:AcrR family transcriptional regulator